MNSRAKPQQLKAMSEASDAHAAAQEPSHATADLAPLHPVRQMVIDMDLESVIFLEPEDTFDRAILGLTDTSAGGITKVIYDSEKCIRGLMATSDMDYEDAEEFFSFNTLGTHMEGWPIFLMRPPEGNDVEADETILSLRLPLSLPATTLPLANGEESCKYLIEVQQDAESGDLFIELPPELIKKCGWQVSDRIHWDVIPSTGGDGSGQKISLTNLDEIARRTPAPQ